MSNSKLKIYFCIFVLLVFLCSCSRGHVDTKKNLQNATDAVTAELEANGIQVIDTKSEYHLAGDLPGSASIKIYIEDYSEEEAVRIFDEVIFPYMSSDNTVACELSLVEGRVPRYGISICSENYNEDGLAYGYSSYTDSGFEVWEHNGEEICLEDYR